MESDRPAGVVVLGSTGSIGRGTLDVLSALTDRLRLVGISAHTRLDDAIAQARRHLPRWLIATCPQQAQLADWSRLPRGTERMGCDDLDGVLRHSDVDCVVSAISGSAGLRGTWTAVDAGKRVALANKETLVMAGPLIMRLARQTGAQLLPVDSEHSAAMQAMSAGRPDEVRRLILTASGGPFLRYPLERLEQVTVEQALDHPTWQMGRKITVDSATMMNKALEIIEARWLFDLPVEKIQVTIHPQSVVHSLIEFVDGAVVAQMSPPDMRLPIQLALTYPERLKCPAAPMDWSSKMQWTFEPPEPERFPALELGYQCAQSGGTAGAVMNAANEIAVHAFLNGQLQFNRIVPACRAVVAHHTFEAQPSLEQILSADRWARTETERWIQG